MHVGTSSCSPPGPRTSRHSLDHFSFRRLRRDAATASWTFERAQDLTNTFAITFLDSIFRGGEMIDPETTAIPDDVVFMSK